MRLLFHHTASICLEHSSHQAPECIFHSETIDQVLREKLCDISGRFSEVKQGRIMHLHRTKIRKAAIWLCEASSTFLFIRKHSANIKTQGLPVLSKCVYLFNINARYIIRLLKSPAVHIKKAQLHFFSACLFSASHLQEESGPARATQPSWYSGQKGLSTAWHTHGVQLHASYCWWKRAYVAAGPADWADRRREAVGSGRCLLGTALTAGCGVGVGTCPNLLPSHFHLGQNWLSSQCLVHDAIFYLWEENNIDNTVMF